MKIKVLFHIILFQLMLAATGLMAQNKQNISVSGKIVEATSQLPVEYATIRLFNKQDSLVTGTITNLKGDFELTSSLKDFYLKIDFIGYSPLLVTNYEITNNQVDLKAIKLDASDIHLNEMVVRAEKTQTVFKPDKRVFNVGQDLVSMGGSAYDVLNNVPAVDVNIEGKVSLRGNANVFMLINGKPSVITSGNSLGTITAEMIDRVEVITNPSAKYDAEGTSGIINIIIKKEDKKGTNGAFSLNTGTPHNHSIGISLNRRTEKFNLFSQLGAGYRRFLFSNYGYTIDKSKSAPTTLFTNGKGEKNEQFYNLILGADYNINPQNILSLSAHLGYEIEDESADLNYKTMDSNNSVFSEFTRKDATDGVNPKMEYQLNYEKTFEGKEKQSLTASATGSYFGKDKTSDFTNQDINTILNMQQTQHVYSEMQYVFTTDYTHPFTETSLLETGAKYEVNDLKNDYSFLNWNESEWIDNPALTNKFDYRQNIGAAYATYSQEMDQLDLKFGLRLENTQVNTLLHNTNKEKKQNYTDLFPSIHSTYKFSDGFSLQAGYSKRISRPDLDDVNPFASYRDEYNLRKGNPDLQSEYTHAFELTMVKIFPLGSLSGSLFHRRTSDVMSQILTVENNVTTTSYENIGKSYSTGIEINSKLNPAKWFTIMLDTYYSNYQRRGQYQEINFDFNSNYWWGRLTTKLKLPAGIDAEIRMRHRSQYKDVQSLRKAQSTMDLGIRKKIMKGRGIFHLSVNDLFNSRNTISVSDEEGFYSYSEYKRGGRRVILGFSFGFGKGEAMEFSGQKIF